MRPVSRDFVEDEGEAGDEGEDVEE